MTNEGSPEEWLAKVARDRNTGLEDSTPEQINQFARFIDNHWVIYFKNDDDWYDIHPLIRAEVDKLVPPSTAASGS